MVITTTTTGVQIVGRGFQMVRSEFKRTQALVFFLVNFSPVLYYLSA